MLFGLLKFERGYAEGIMYQCDDFMSHSLRVGSIPFEMYSKSTVPAFVVGEVHRELMEVAMVEVKAVECLKGCVLRGFGLAGVKLPSILVWVERLMLAMTSACIDIFVYGLINSKRIYTERAYGENIRDYKSCCNRKDINKEY